MLIENIKFGTASEILGSPNPKWPWIEWLLIIIMVSVLIYFVFFDKAP